MSEECAMEGDKAHLPTEPHENDLAGKLRKLGLDPEKWLPLLSQILGITNLQVLEHTGFEDYFKIENKAEYPWEKNSLRKLFNVEDGCKRLSQIQNDRVKRRKKNQDDSRKTLEELKKMMDEGKTRLSKEVSKQEEKLRISMDIPKESWPSKNEPLREVIETLHKELDVTDEVLGDITTLSDKEVLRNASGGLALEGIYMTMKHDDVLKKREQLLALPEQFHLTGPQKGSVFDQKEFLSSTAELAFHTTMDNLGFSIASSAKAGFWGFQAEANYSSSTSKKSKKKNSSQKEQTYICTTKYNYIPLASSYISKDQLRLSEAALGELKSTEELVTNSNAAYKRELTRQRYEHFFNRFGSHANQGTIHFGGIFWWKATSQGFSEDKLEEIKEEHSMTLNTYVGVSYAGRFSAAVDVTKNQSEKAFHKKKELTLTKQTQLHVTTSGGPPAVNSHGSWKCGLVANNKTWNVIDRGIYLIPVWEIILLAHRQDFQDVYQVSKDLIKVYEESTNQPQQLLYGENISSALDDARTFLSDLSSWEVTAAEQQLRSLLDFKQKLNDKTRNYTVWANVCLSDRRLQEFLKKIIESYKISKSDATFVRSQIKCLLQYYEFSQENITAYSSIIKWVHQSGEKQNPVAVTDFETFINFLSQSRKELKFAFNTGGSEEEIYEAQIKINMNILSAINLFIKVLRHTGQTDLKLLVLSVMSSVGYSIRNNDFQYLLGWQEMKFMEMEIQRLHKEYHNLNALEAHRAQAFVLKAGLTAGDGVKPKSVEQKRDLLYYMVEDMKCYLEQDILDVLEMHSGCNNFHSLEEDLNLFIAGKFVAEKQKSEEMTNKIKYACQTASADILTTATSNALEQDTEESARISTNQEFNNLIQNLGLEKYFPKKMSRRKFCSLSRASPDNVKTEGDLPACFVQMLMTLDYRFRYLVCNKTKEANNPGNGSYSAPAPTMFNTADDFLNDFPEEVERSTEQVSGNIHPADILMTIFHCADDFTRQYMYSKLSLCHFALPLLVPRPYSDAIELPLWAFRLVQKNILVPGQSGASKPQEKPICDVNIPFVCFTRIGKSNISKSQILNNLLSTSKHDIFYHRNCKGCETKPILMEGVTEIYWFCPSGKDENQYEACTAFVNLHGDARKQHKQSEFLLKISSVNIVLFSESEMDKTAKDLLTQMLTSSKPLICLCPDREFSPGNNTAAHVKIGLKNQNEATVLEVLFRTLKRLLTLSENSHSLETCAQTGRNCGFLVDEDGAECAEGKATAMSMCSFIKENNLTKSKEELLPISGQLWHSWCKKDKELTRLENKMKRSIEQHKGEIESEKMAIRFRQLQRAKDNDFMLSFIAALKSLPNPTKLFFLQWFKLFIDHSSSDQIFELQYQYNQLWSSIRTEKSKNNARSQQDMDKLSKEINASMFGLEHVLREVGQTYEVIGELKLRDECFLELPKIAADMMASGYPIELMDGDACYLPLKWIGSVLEELIKIIGDKKLFVLSVLGVQSSGKSTLLNAMFGLQFAVSAGRCTRGAFMQLVEIEEKLKKDLGFDFILVVDTEGLRSTELVNHSNQNHDNELATFVIGVGNMTLINVFGENPSEIKDILQIAVQAFLRMKQIKLSPSCLFVHQNVSEMSAAVKSLECRIGLEKELDSITCLAAELELCNDVQRFRDVIRFDAERHIRYFAHLWLGNPPMAPPNPVYSQNAQKVRSLILEVGKTEAKSLLSISELRVRIEDLWQALKNENFVFSFKNTLEISAYSKVENRYNQWTWQLRRHVLELQVKLSNMIKKGELDYLIRKDVETKVNEKFFDIDKELETFFDDDKDKETLIQWKANVKNRLRNLHIELVEETKRQGEDLLRLKKSQNKAKQRETDYEEELFRKSKQVALTLRNEDLNEDYLREHFSTLWQSWVMEIKTSVPPLETPDFVRDAEDIIFQHFREVPGITDKMSNFANLSLSIDFSKHISMKKALLRSKTLTDHDIYFIYQVVENLEKKVNDYLEEKHNKNVDYSIGYFYEIISMILEDLDSKSKDNGNFTFTKDFKSDLSLNVFRKAVLSFKELHQVFHLLNDPVEVLEDKREEFFNCFKISCDGATSITIFANFLCSKLITEVSSAVYSRTALAVVDEMSCNFPAFSGNRSKLETYILIYLAEHEDFEKYRQYLHFPEQFFESYIEDRVEDYCLSHNPPKLNDFINISLDHFYNVILLAIAESTQVATDKKCNVSGWLDEFYTRVTDIVSFSRSDLRSIEHQEIKDFEFIKEAMSKAWDEAMDILKTKLDRSSFKPFEIKPSKILVKQLCGCWVQCPFCKAICTNTIPGHDGDHSVPFHRSQAINGISWIDSDEFVTEICSSLVSSNINAVISNTQEIPYKNYRKIGPNYEKWSIMPDTSSQPYWRWFVSHFRTNLEKDYGCKFEGRGAIPPQWETISKNEVIAMLQEQLGTKYRERHSGLSD